MDKTINDMKKIKEQGYQWNYVSVGGVTRVAITSGEDIAHLGELDQKKWTVLSCPVKGLEFEEKTLALIDKDGDGRVRAQEVIEAADWLTSVIKDKDSILKGESTLPLANINTDNEKGAGLYNSAKKILENLGLEKDSIGIEDTADTVAIFAKTRFNGDGVVTEASTDDEELKKVISACVASFGGIADRSGAAGVNADILEKFYAALADYSAWKAAAEADKAGIFPYGDDTESALASCEAIKDKVADYFMRCKLIKFYDAAADAVDISAEKVVAISDKNLATCADEIAQYPLARPGKDQILPFDAVNPAWQDAFAKAAGFVFKDKTQITEAEWNEALASFGAYTAWKSSKKGTEVEGLGLEAVEAFLKDDRKADILALIAEDEAVKAEAEGIDEVCKLTYLYRDFYKLLKSYISFYDFYSPEAQDKAIFEAGELYIDERCCKLCIKVEDMSKQAEIAMSNMFLVYCACTSKTKGQTINIVAALTAGDTGDLRPGKNGIFYDREGNDWDATIIGIVDNPISIRNAFWAPYRKFARFISEKIDKAAAEKDAASFEKLQAAAPTEDKTKQVFDIAKYAGLFAAVSVGMAALGAAFAAVIAVIKGLVWWKWLVVIAAIILVISGPSCFIAWRKLRKRNLGPVLNANGWAVNSLVLINILFGATLTSIAKYPVIKAKDPYKKTKTPAWLRILELIIILAAVGFVLYLTDNLTWLGITKVTPLP